ncbi:MAG: Holliday junction resolvase RuvX [Holosporaceae bacterium]|jgi:putative Holliday junction resolvase|nr:Holliday junction resolvase RuvX [Holosporaceae bacterium]
MTEFFIKNLEETDLGKLTAAGLTAIGLDIGDKTVGVAVSDDRIKIAGGVGVISRKGTGADFELLAGMIENLKAGLIIFGWPLQTNGLPGQQCEKVLEFVRRLSEYTKADFAKWDERFSTKAVNNVMIQADMSRKKRAKVTDKAAAVYILQGAIDFMNCTGFRRQFDSAGKN